jgi:Raf kinase inhibitor-like YbhB/YbcL family protein
MPFLLDSPAFADGHAIPAKYTADGENLSPPLRWSGAPAGTRSFILKLEDPDAPAGVFRHWGLYNIAGSRNALPEGVGHGAKTESLGQGVNDFGHPRYDGPAPPKGRGRHRYCFYLAALDVEELTQAPKARVEEIWQAAQKHVLGVAELVGTYER